MLALALALTLAAPEPPAGAAPDAHAPVAVPASLTVPAPERPAPGAGLLRSEALLGGGAGVVVGDLLVVGAGYLTLQLFARDTIDPTAENFRRSAYVLGGTALLLPPLASALGAAWASPGPRRGRVWRAVLLGVGAQLAAATAGWLAAPRYWVALPVQLVAVSLTSSIGLHWGGRDPARAPPARAARAGPPAPPAAPAALAAACPLD